MRQAIYGRLDVFCPTCGSLNQRKIGTLKFEGQHIVVDCIGCDEIISVVLLAEGPEVDKPVDETPVEKIEELAELTRTRVTPKSLSKRTKVQERARDAE